VFEKSCHNSPACDALQMMGNNLADRLQIFEILARQHETMLTAFVRSIIADQALA
jgi:hypothetical protein